MGWMKPIKASRIRRITLAFLLVFLLTILFRGRQDFLSFTAYSQIRLIPASAPSGVEHLRSAPVQRFWRDLRDKLDGLNPKVQAVVLADADRMDRHLDAIDLEKHPDMLRADVVKLSDNTFMAIQNSHDGMLKVSRAMAPSLPYWEQTRGIVTTAGGRYFGIVTTSLRMLRRTGSRLPAVVFLDTHDDYDALICEEVLPSLNAECIILSDLLDTATLPEALKSYQYKIFAILFSPFQEVLFLDADAFPAHNPDGLFDSEPYTSTGMVTWPDFWWSTTSHLIYDIVRAEVPPLSARRSSEAGILLYDKSRHAQDLLLVLYYNIFGPGCYYPLLSQGAPGEGDKDTFLLAAMVVGAKWYDVKSPVRVIGRHLNGSWESAGMKQADPAEEWALDRKKSRTGKYSELRRVNENETKDVKPARALFIHNNIVKLDIEKLLDHDNAIRRTNETGQMVRLWGPAQDLVQDFGYDVEEVLWEELIIGMCQLSTVDRCERMKKLATTVLGKTVG